jgi:F0F1-type ATP synthase epsilon subunit
MQVTFCTSNGYTTILPNHAKIIGCLSPGIVIVKYPTGEKQELLQNYGLFYFENNKLSIISDYANFLNNTNNLTELNIIQKIIDTQSNKESYPKEIRSILDTITQKIIKSIKNKNASK